MDERNYAILDIVEQTETPIWKKRIWETLQDRMDHYPGFDSFSIQTVGRRVNTLHEQEMLQETITHMEESNRGLLQVYVLTPKGAQALQDEREQRLREIATQHMGTLLGTGELTVTPTELENLFTSFFKIEPSSLPETGRVQAILDFLVDEFSDKNETSLQTRADQEFKSILAQESPRFSTS